MTRTLTYFFFDFFFSSFSFFFDFFFSSFSFSFSLSFSFSFSFPFSFSSFPRSLSSLAELFLSFEGVTSFLDLLLDGLFELFVDFNFEGDGDAELSFSADPVLLVLSLLVFCEDAGVDGLDDDAVEVGVSTCFTPSSCFTGVRGSI